MPILLTRNIAVQAVLNCDVQFGQRVAASGMLVLQNAQSLVVDAAAGGLGMILFTHLISRKTAKAMIRNSMIVLMKLPYAMATAPAFFASASVSRCGPLRLTYSFEKST